jgi:hypothetical protein
MLWARHFLYSRYRVSISDILNLSKDIARLTVSVNSVQRPWHSLGYFPSRLRDSSLNAYSMGPLQIRDKDQGEKQL